MQRAHGHVLEHLRAEGVLVTILRIALQNQPLHEPGRHDTARAGTQQTDDSGCHIALPYHKHDDDEPHAEGRSKVGERYILVFLEVTAELFILGQRDDGGVIAQKREHSTQ